mgnify:CR=1 FL=1|tara:strand:- start:477 stop:863 length:387 start_codon:yes stop_codon:yes gene_type:complete
MSKLPTNMLSTPNFDSPLRRTGQGAKVIASPTSPLVPALKSVEGGAAKPKVTSARKRAPKPEKVVPELEARATSESPEEALEQRFSLRLTQDQFRALETHVFERKMTGAKINAASLMREILDEWIAAK